MNENVDLLAAVADFQRDDYVMTDAEAAALSDMSGHNRPTISLKFLPKPPRFSHFIYHRKMQEHYG